ncbi:VWA domain-containing protein [Halorubellus sp. JP-L1]|uniref:VWA domain-containing protein n=1 Tax=Halorubellus sp. JP-L1 TaxID=2715753 RepID=UPI001409D83E|nr:VWA domain-containing protein [Halorubellus sp. JP-L1]NHN42956.1 VWA domain-containing protein [Halorubellus sp. JP-L1]
MDTALTELDGGDRCAITVTVRDHQTHAIRDRTVHRLTVETTEGEVLHLFGRRNPESDLAVETGRSYAVADVLASTSRDPLADDEAWCPDCSGTIRPGCHADVADTAISTAARDGGATDAGEVTGAFGVVDDRTTFSLIQEEADGTDADAVDDWQPMRDARPPSPPAYVCTDCGRELSSYEVQRPADERERTRSRTETEAVADAAPTEILNSAVDSAAAAPSEETLGMAAGGAKDVGNFRENVAEGYTPQPEAISDEGLFYDYHFETGERDATDSAAAFSPRYATGASEHPVSGEREYFVSVGLDSTLSMAEFERPRLDLVAVLDVSGSMDSPFDAYYYDEHDRRHEVDDAGTKMEAAADALCALTEQLDADDRLGVVLYNSRAHLAKPLRDVGSTNMDAIRRHIRDVQAGGGTNLEDGFEAAVDLLQDAPAEASVERRVVFMTDMMPNTGRTGEGALTERFERAAEHGIHTTFVGMGLDENAELADALSGVRGANHYFVHSTAEFERRLGDEFDYMVTPLVYDLALDLDAGAHDVAAVHGAPDADPESGRLLSVGTLFPSAKTEGEARGGVVLVRLDPEDATTPNATPQNATTPNEREREPLALEASWTERDGTEHAERVTITLPEETPWYGHDGVRKAVGLSRYARELRTWARDVHHADDRGVDDWLVADQGGEHERESVSLHVSSAHAARFAELDSYLEREQAGIGDETLQQERDLLATLQEAVPGARSDRGVSE